MDPPSLFPAFLIFSSSAPPLNFFLRAFVLNNGPIYSLSKIKTIPASLQEYLRFVSLLVVGYLHKKSLYSLSVKDTFITSVVIFINRLFFCRHCRLATNIWKIIIPIATRFHREAYSDRLRDNKYALKSKLGCFKDGNF